METVIHASSGIRIRDTVLEQAKTVHALEGATTVIGHQYKYEYKIYM
jgi:hypothetical protein